jgi:hypothetical protein
MEIGTLKNNLLEAYTAENLNKISAILLNYYNNQQFGTLQKIADIISDFIDVEIDENGKGFSKLMMLYHPDRRNFHLDKINAFATGNNFDKLLEYSHILKLERIEEISSLLESLEDIDYSPVYEWDLAGEGFSVSSFTGKRKHPERQNTKPNKKVSFYDAMKIRQYGHVKISFPPCYFEDIDEFEMSGSDINDLDGIEYCIHAQNIDLSDNSISDITLLNTLGLLEYLNLSDNKIELICPLEAMPKLKEINLENNQIGDISPLFSIPNLSYVNLCGNPVQGRQIEKLKEKGISVDFDRTN